MTGPESIAPYPRGNTPKPESLGGRVAYLPNIWSFVSYVIAVLMGFGSGIFFVGWFLGRFQVDSPAAVIYPVAMLGVMAIWAKRREFRFGLVALSAFVLACIVLGFLGIAAMAFSMIGHPLV